MARLSRETMCVQNIGQTNNNGDLIPEGVPVRKLFGVQGNIPSVTALSDTEIIELSKHNEAAVIPGRREYDQYYRIKIFGQFCLNNRCYAVMRPCMCVLGEEDGMMTITTAKFSTMNSITRLINRLKQDIFSYAIIYRTTSNGELEEIKRFNVLEALINYIVVDKRGGNNEEELLDSDELMPRSSSDLTDYSELQERIKELERQLENTRNEVVYKDNLLREKDKELMTLTSENSRLKTVLQSVRNIVMQ